MESLIEDIWILVCTILVFTMQVGFCCLEAGAVRSKNSINVVLKNFSDFSISIIIYCTIGYSLMYGESYLGLIGTDTFFLFKNVSEQNYVNLLYQAAFCCTAVTILSGAVAERIRFKSYLLISIWISLVVYPVFGHWVWGGNSESQLGWLQKLGFVDFAGGSVVHILGATIALAGIITLGPRTGRFDSNKNTFYSQSIPLMAIGVLVLWIGWLGFNGGSAGKFDQQTPALLLNTLLAGCVGSSTILVWSLLFSSKDQVTRIINGALSGLVAVTACCYFVTPAQVLLIASLGAIIADSTAQLLERLKVDDVIQAIPVHGAAGVWGVICVALFGNLEIIGTELSRWNLLTVQLLGIGVCISWTFITSFSFLWLLNKVSPIRVSVEEEKMGLNLSESSSTTEFHALMSLMQEHHESGNLNSKIDLDPYSEAGQIANLYNNVTAKVNDEIETRKLAQLKAETALEVAMSSDSANQAKSSFLANMSHEIRTPLNGIQGSLRLLSKTPLTKQQEHYLGLANISSVNLLALINDILDFSKIEAGKMELNLEFSDIRILVESVVQQVVQRAEDQKILVACIVDPSVPETVLCDPLRITQILLNLTGNAVKFTKQGSVTIFVSTSDVTDTDCKLRFEVRDTGIGIPEEKQGKLFTAFEQADSSTTKKFGGTGLGLTISRLFVEMMKGKIGVESTEGQGSTFWFEISAERQATETETNRYFQVCSERFRIISVNEDAHEQKIIYSQLENWGINIECCNSFNDMLDILNTSTIPFTAALLSYEITKKHATDIQRMKETSKVFSKLPIATLLSGPEMEDALKHDDLVIKHQIFKPLNPSQIFDSIISILISERSPKDLDQKHNSSNQTSNLESFSFNARVLVAEDNHINQIITEELLSELELEHEIVDNGLKAVKAYTQSEFDLILLDCHMPEMDGFEAAKEIRSYEERSNISPVPIVALTADVTTESQEKCKSVGMNFYLSKPLDPEKLNEALKLFLKPLGSNTNCEKKESTNHKTVVSEKIIDFEELEKRYSNNEKIISMVLTHFEKQLIADLPLLESIIAGKDSKALFEQAHALKGAASAVSATQVRKVISCIEDLARENDMESARKHFTELSEASNRALKFLESHIERA